VLLISHLNNTYFGTSNKIINDFKNWKSFGTQLDECTEYPCKIYVFPQWSKDSYIILKQKEKNERNY